MNKQILVLATVLILMLTACNRDFTYVEANQRNGYKFDDEKMVVETQFILELQSASMLMQELSTEVNDKAYSVEAKEYTKAALKQYKLLSVKIDILAVKEGIRLTETMKPEHLEIYYQVRKQEKKNLDRVYLEEVTHLQSGLLKKMKDLSTSAKDDNVRSFIAENSGMVEEYLDRSIKAQNELI
ncbi:MAG: DUF4142 domain-containing protein [Cyclobacteriaceae bacterium]